MRSAASIAGHPLHPMMVVVPAGGFILTLVMDVVYVATGANDWWTATRPVLLVSVIGGLLAALPGAIDLVAVVPRGRATNTGVAHMIVNLMVVALFAANAWMRWNWPYLVPPNGGAGLVLSAVGVAMLGVSGTLGWMLVQRFHVGVLELHEGGLLPYDTPAELVYPRQPYRDPSLVNEETEITETEVTETEESVERGLPADR